MNEEVKSYRQILRSTSIIGGASIINISIGLVRVKAIAVLLGPTGVGLIGLFSNLMSTAANIAALGMGTVGTRQIAEANGQHDPKAVAIARRSLFWGTLLMAVIGTIVFWLLRGVLATHILANTTLSSEVGWLALGVGLTVASGSQGALLNGLRRIGYMARISMYSAVLGSTLGVGTLFLWHERGLMLYLLLSPISSFVLGHWYVSRLPKVDAPHIPLRQLTQKWYAMARFGIAFMLAGLAATIGQLVVRSLVQRELGTEALGLFEASWVISMTYIGFVLRAMGTDYYPRLTAIINNRNAVNKLINEQTEIALILASPIFLIMLSFTPWVIEALYSGKFLEAAIVLRWQIMGDLFKIVSWPLGFVLLAGGTGKKFLFAETFVTAIFVLTVWIGLPRLGLQSTGLGFLLMYMFYLPLVYFLARRRTKFTWNKSVFLRFCFLTGAGSLIFIFSYFSEKLAAASGILIAVIFTMHGVMTLRKVWGKIPKKF